MSWCVCPAMDTCYVMVTLSDSSSPGWSIILIRHWQWIFMRVLIGLNLLLLFISCIYYLSLFSCLITSMIHGMTERTHEVHRKHHVTWQCVGLVGMQYTVYLQTNTNRVSFQVVNLQCIDSHALANAYNVSCHMTAAGMLDDHQQASGQEWELQQYTGIATAPAKSNTASNRHWPYAGQQWLYCAGMSHGMQCNISIPSNV